MSMRLTLTPRMAWIAALCLVALLALMFAIGVQLGRMWPPAVAAAAQSDQSNPARTGQSTPPRIGLSAKARADDAPADPSTPPSRVPPASGAR